MYVRGEKNTAKQKQNDPSETNKEHKTEQEIKNNELTRNEVVVVYFEIQNN
jgi:hypothetical protein